MRVPERGRRSSRQLGEWGERRATRHLTSRGYRIVDRNWRSGSRDRPGELDVVAVVAGVLVVCEVKTRRTVAFGGGAPAVDAVKQARIRALTELWLLNHAEFAHLDVRFDVIAIEGARLTHYERAF